MTGPRTPFAGLVLGSEMHRPPALCPQAEPQWDPSDRRFWGPELDQWLQARPGECTRSLAPGGGQARGFSELCRAQIVDQPSAARRRVAARGLAAVMATLLESFPNNLFCDCDALLGEGLRHYSGTVELENYFAQICSLVRDYGRCGGISFRYAHDFLYGFDWSKWRLRDPSGRAGARPFGPELLAHLSQRATELRRAIADGDKVYPQLAAGRFRNPFGFLREPEDEVGLLVGLSGRDELPIAAWTDDPKLQVDRNFAAIRRRRAVELGIASRPGGDGSQSLE